MPFLKLDNISIRTNDKWILRDVSVEIEAGEIFGILGKTGAGKSTLLRILKGTETFDGGAIFLNGEKISKAGREKLGIRSVLHLDELSPRKTAEESVSAVFKAGKFFREEPKQEVEEIFNSFNLTNIKANRVGELSDGQKQMVALAVAMASKPKLLLLDSALNSLDYQLRVKMLAGLKELAKQNGTTVVYATQNQDEAFLFCDRAAILHNGEFLQIGSPMDIYAEPKTVSAADFLGRNNLIRAGRLNSSKATLSEFQTIEGNHRLFVDNAEKGRLGAINQTVTLMIRPENLILTFGAAFPEDNLLKAVITDIKRMGATTRILLDANGLNLEAQVIRLIGLNVGDTCMVGLPTNRIRVLKD